MRRWLGLAIVAGLVSGGLLVFWSGDAPFPQAAQAAADVRFELCVENSKPQLVGGHDPSLACMRRIGSELPQCSADASTITGPLTAHPREAITTDDGHGGRCFKILPAESFGPHDAGCPRAASVLGEYRLRAKRYASRRCPRPGTVAGELAQLPSGRIGLVELSNRLNVVLDRAPDGVPRGGGFRRLPPRERSPVPAISTLPTAGACGHGESRARLVTARIEPDTSVPRCLAVHARQGLRIVNATGEYGGRPRTITVRFIGFAQRIKPGHAAVFRRPFGTYLAPGDHVVRSTYRGNGPEIFLVR